MAAVIDTRRMSPAISEMRTEETMPFGAALDASLVSSATWAEASYPVSVYWVMSRPMATA